MNTLIDPQTAVGWLVSERLDRARVLESHHIDYCCGGRQTLEEACRKAGVAVQTVLAELCELEEQTAPADATEWPKASLAELMDNILDVHHAYVRAELPRLSELSSKVVAAHGASHPELILIQEVYGALRQELEEHMMKEERVLFPWIRALEAGASLTALPPFSIEHPMECMEKEHEHAGEALARMREFSSNYAVPPDACNTWRVYYDSLVQFEEDLHLHIHKENNLLHPRARKLAGERGAL